MVEHLWKSLRAACVAALASGLLGAAAAQEPRGMNLEQVAQLRSVTSAVMSPDGARVAYVVSVPRELFEDEDGSSWSELHVVEVASGVTRPFITGQGKVGSVQWRPGAAAISFLAKRSGDDHTSLYQIPVDGGEASRLVALESGISEYAWSPDGSQAALVATQAPDKEVKELVKKGFDVEVYEEDWRPSLVWIARPGGDVEEPRFLDLAGSASLVRWSPNGKRLAVALAPRPLVDDSYMFRRVHVVEVASGKVLSKIDNPGKLGEVAWSPDGKHVAMISGVDIHDSQAGSLMVAPAGGETPRDLTSGFPGLVEDFWWQDDGAIVFLASQGVEQRLFRMSVGGGTAERLDWSGEAPALAGMTVAEGGTIAAFLGDTARHPREVFAGKLGGASPRRLTTSNPWLDGVALARQEVVRYVARDGLEIEGILVYPLEYREGTRYPLVLIVHGGPESHHSNGWMTSYSRPAQVLAARGFAVFFTNYRGSTGRGVAFSKLSLGDPAGEEFDDLVDAVDHLIGIGLVDRNRVGVTGGSYGGYATAWCSTRYSDRFAAGVMYAGISDNISRTGTTEIPEEEYLVHATKRPWEDFSWFLERSPIAHVQGAKTPLLIAHGSADSRVHPGQSMELYRFLKILGQAPVRLVFYPGEGHGNSRAASRYDFSLRLVRWMEHYLQGPGGDPPPYQLDYSAARPAKESAESE